MHVSASNISSADAFRIASSQASLKAVIFNGKGEVIFYNYGLLHALGFENQQEAHAYYKKGIKELIPGFSELIGKELTKLQAGNKARLIPAEIQGAHNVLPALISLESFMLEPKQKAPLYLALLRTEAESDDNLTGFSESRNAIIWLVDKEFKIVNLNSSFIRFGIDMLKKNFVVGDSALSIFPDSDQETWTYLLQRAFNGEEMQGEIQLSLNKKKHVFEYLINPIYDSERAVEGASVVLLDISDRNQIEIKLKEGENQFRSLADNLNDAIILRTKDEIIYVNPACERLFGIKADDIRKKTDIIEKSIVDEDQEDFQKSREQLKQEKCGSLRGKYRLKIAKGAEKWVWLRTSQICDSNEKPFRELTLISDLTGQFELETTLSTTRLQQKAILDNIPYLAWLKDNKGKYISVNEPFLQFFNLSQETTLGKSDAEIFEQPLSQIQEKYDTTVRVAQKKKYFEDEWKVKGNPCWVETFAAPIFDNRGNLIGITGIARDITDRKSMEETIIKNEEHFRSLLQYSSDAITILDKAGIIMFESALRNRISDFMIDELIGKPFADIIHPDDIHIFSGVLEELLDSPKSQFKVEYRSLHKNKRWIYVESIFSNHISNPSIRGIVVNTRDISDRKMAELKERVYHDNLVFLSNSALELLGLSGKDEIYKYIADKLHNFLEDSIVVMSSFNELENTFQIESVAASLEYREKLKTIYAEGLEGQRYVIKDLTKSIQNAGTIGIFQGSDDDLDINSQLLQRLSKIRKSMNVNKIYYISMSRDNKLLGNILVLTLNKTIIKFKHILETFVHQVSVALQRSHLEYELIQAKTRAEESDKLKTAFLANMSHEIRTPMNGILGFAEMLNDDHLGEGNRKKYVDIINNNGKMLMNLIDDIIDFAKIEAGEIKILKQEFSLNALLTQVHSSFLSESLRKERNEVKLRIRKALNNEECYIQTDPNRLRQVLMNLVGNAFKFTKEGYIEFGYYKPEGGFIEFYVKDSGIGIPEDKINRIFERFVQADASRSRKYSGSGLGLAISKGFVELLGGSMWASSEENEGSVFSFSIPYVPATRTEKEEVDKKKPRSDYNWEDKLFLIAEDDTFSFKLLEGFLKKTKASVLHAEDGQRAVDICKDNPKIDLILMDVQMPEMNGMDATRIIKKTRKDLPIIAQTANALAEEKQRCFEAGFDDFVTKPINISELLMKMDQWLTSK